MSSSAFDRRWRSSSNPRAGLRLPRRLLEETQLNLGPSKILGLVFNDKACWQSRYGKHYYA
jgi:hypothetical protein